MTQPNASFEIVANRVSSRAMERFLTTEQVAEALQVHLNTVRRWLRTGELQGRKFGRVWRVSECEMKRLEQTFSNSSAATLVTPSEPTPQQSS